MIKTPLTDALLDVNPDYVSDVYGQMYAQFGHEWLRLRSQDRVRLVEDLLYANKAADGCSVFEYQRRIGKGNLSNYVESLRICQEKTDD